MSSELPRIAVFSGPTATIQNSPPLLTSNKARTKYGLPLLTTTSGDPLPVDNVRAQRLAKPVTVYVEAYSAHPLESDARELYAPPDGYLDESGAFHSAATSEADVPVYEVTLEPSDGLYMLPYMGRQADGSPWDEACAFPLAPEDQARQTFYPNAQRIYEEIDRFGLENGGRGSILTSQASFDFYRAAPSGGYKKGLPASKRTDTGEGDIPPETLGEDFFIYYPQHLRAEPLISTLAKATNMVQEAMSSGQYEGAQWLEGSPTTEESMYWLNLLIDTSQPLVGHSAQRAHQTLSADGDRNIADGVKYILSGIWKHGGDRDVVGGVMLVDEVVFHSREVTKTDARPGNYQATGGHGGVVALMGGHGDPQLTYIPTRKHTYTSDVNLSRLPDSVSGVCQDNGYVGTTQVQVKDRAGWLMPSAMPRVTIAKYARYNPSGPGKDPMDEVEVMARIEANLAGAPLSGFIGEGASPYGSMNGPTDEAFRIAAFTGMPVVRCGRGNTGGNASKNDPTFVAGSNLTSTKARLLLMASMLKLGSLPPAADPLNPTPDEVAATTAKVAEYQAIFDTH